MRKLRVYIYETVSKSMTHSGMQLAEKDFVF